MKKITYVFVVKDKHVKRVKNDVHRKISMHPRIYTELNDGEVEDLTEYEWDLISDPDELRESLE